MAIQKIVVCGSPESGKTTISIKMAKIIEHLYKKTVTVVFAQDKGGPLSYAFRNVAEEGGSLGELITRPNIKRDDILEKLLIPKNVSDVAFLGYQYGERKENYPDLNPDQVRDFFNILGSATDYIIVDASNDYTTNLISKVALERFDTVVCVGSGDIKSLAYQKSANPQIKSLTYAGIDVMIINNTKGFTGIAAIAEQNGGDNYILPYDVRLLEQSLEGKMMDDVGHIKWSKKKQSFDSILEEIVQEMIVVQNK